MLKIKYDEPIADTSAQRGVARALIDQSVRWGNSFDGSFLYQWDTSETPYTVVLNGTGLSYDSGTDAFTAGVVTGIDLNINFVLSATITGLAIDALALQDYIDASLAAAGNLAKILNPVFNNTPMRVVGSSGNDTLEGGNRNDVILGKAGDDLIIATKGNDRIDGGEGEDTVAFEDLSSLGGVNVDLGTGTMITKSGGVSATLTNIECIAGTRKADHLGGDEGNNCIYGLAGVDVILGGGGKDQLFGEAGNDAISGDSGNDLVDGGDGNDTLYGDDGKDILKGQSGADDLRGNSGADRLIGGRGQDILNGGLGNDVLIGGPGDDTFLFGDELLFAGPFGDDTITDFEMGDLVNVKRRAYDGHGADRLFAVATQVGNDTLVEYTEGAGGTVKATTVLNDVIAADLIFQYDQYDITFYL